MRATQAALLARRQGRRYFVQGSSIDLTSLEVLMLTASCLAAPMAAHWFAGSKSA